MVEGQRGRIPAKSPKAGELTGSSGIKLHLVLDKLSSLLETGAPLGLAASTQIHRAPRGGRKKLAKGHKAL